jgi:ABC-type Fe3+-hydroxamate transport system substrate-binding protein
VARVRGTKNPDLAAIRALSPDLVVANQEENRELDVRRLREAGVAVWVTRIETVEEALASMSRLFAEALGLADPDWLVEARSLWSVPVSPRLSVAVPIWRDPWMVVGSSTYTHDLLARAGLVNVLADREGRYPSVTPDEIDGAGADVVLLPDEPYVFTADDGPEALATPTRLVSGRLLTWYGPAMVEAHAMLATLAG